MKINQKNLAAYSLSRDHIDKEGFLHKRGEVNRAFQRRWFVLKGNLLFYFEKKSDREPVGVIILEGCTTELAESEEYYVFKLIFPGSNSRVYELGAESQEELEAWMKYISRASYDYLKVLVAELQKQLEEIEESEKSSGIVYPISSSSLSGSVLHQQRENPFNRDNEVSFTELWKLNETVQNASSLLSKSCATGSGSIYVNPSLPPSIPFRPAPPIPLQRDRKNTKINKKSFPVLHQEYGVPIQRERASYTLTKFIYEYVKLVSDVTKTNNVESVENLIDL